MNILITGGGSGLGKAITLILAQHKETRVYFTFSKTNPKSIESQYSNVKGIKCDFTQEKEISQLIEQLPTLEIDVLINNAYFGDVTPTYFHKDDIQKFEDDFCQNTIPTLQITQEIIKLFRKKKSGKIISILTSYLANVPPSGLSSYIANKSYLEKMTKIWASENSKFGITSNSVSPSFMRTNFTDTVDERVIEQMEGNHPLKKLLTIEEVAETVLFLTRASVHINGVDILMNAGVNIK